MKFNLRRFLWWIFLALLLIMTIAVVRYAKKNFTGLGPIPARSSFAGRLPSVEGSPNVFRFYYATNRENSENTFDKQGNLLADEISTGTFDVHISPYLSVQPFVWFDTESMAWKARNALTQEPFWQQLVEAVHNSPKKSLLIIVWGFRDWFRSAALKTAYTAYVLDINTPVLLFDWPGNQGEGRSGYMASQQMTTPSAKDLGKVLAQVIQKTGSENVWLLGSSLGCQTICESFKWLAEQSEPLQDKQKISQVILSAPDVSAEAFDNKFAEYIQSLCRHLTAYVSSNDRALLMSHWLNRSRRLGRKAQVLMPPDERSMDYEFEEALELLDLQKKGARNIDVVDATPINTVRNLHHFFTDSPVFFDDLYQRLLRPDDIISRRLHTVRVRPEGVEYWILWND